MTARSKRWRRQCRSWPRSNSERSFPSRRQERSPHFSGVSPVHCPRTSPPHRCCRQEVLSQHRPRPALRLRNDKLISAQVENDATKPALETRRLGMAKKKTADLLVETLAAAGVERIYGVSGDSLNGITDSIRRQEQIRWAHVRHEETAAFAAAAEAHLTGRLAVCAGTWRPGDLPLGNGLSH